MRLLEKAVVAACLALGLALLACVATGAWAYTDPANVTSATLSDMRVNPSQSVTWTLGQVLDAGGNPVGTGNSSLALDGVNQYVLINNDASLAVGAEFTMEGWFTPQSFSNYMFLLGKRADSVDSFYIISYSSGGAIASIECRFAAGGNYYDITPQPTITLGGPNHIVLIKNGATIQAYVNGAPSATKAVAGSLTNVNNYYVGEQSGVSYPFDGVDDEIRFYNRALSPTEVAQHVQGIYLNETGLVLYLDLDGEALDQSGNGNDGTLVNGPAYTDGWASVPVSTYFNATQSVASRRILVNSTTGAALSTVPDTAPATWGNYTAELAPDNSIGNATVAPFLVDTYLVDVYTVHPEIDAGFNTLLYAIGTSRLGDHSLTDGDTLTIEGVAFAWNSYTDRFETTDSETTPQTRTYDTLTALSEATYGITSGAVNVTAAVTWVTPQLDLVQVYLSTGDLLGAVYIMATAQLGGLFLYTFMMVGVSLAVYNYTGPEATLLAWMLGWGTFSAVVHGEAVGVALILLALGGGLLIAKMFLDRRAA